MLAAALVEEQVVMFLVVLVVVEVGITLQTLLRLEQMA